CWQAEDCSGNLSAVECQTITVQDTTDPVIGTPGDGATINCPAVPVFTAPTATDECDTDPSVNEVSDNTTPGSCAGTYTRIVCWQAEDCNGNVSNIVCQEIRVVDITPPVITCAANDTVECGDTVKFTDPIVTDECDLSPTVSVLSTDTVNNLDGTKTITRTWEGSDDCGNRVSCSQSVLVKACAQCGLTQGFYGGKGKYCDGTKVVNLISRLLSTGNLVIGGIAPGTNNVITFTQADSTCLNKRMPGGGSSVPLNGIATCANPVGIALQNNRFKNTLLGQTIALGLNLRLDTTLGDVVIAGTYMTTVDIQTCGTNSPIIIPGSEETFVFNPGLVAYLGNNYTIAQLYALANSYLSGNYGSSPRLAGLLAGALGSANEGFDECRSLAGFSNTALRLAKQGSDEVEFDENTSINSLLAYPNPSNSVVTFELEFATDLEKVSLQVFNVSGQKVADLYNGSVTEGVEYKFEFNASNLAQGTYYYRLNTNEETKVGKLAIIK
ncbi:MAG: T9SS type A sorting domain-containing protein, partial [Bacteroidota bacterium]